VGLDAVLAIGAGSGFSVVTEVSGYTFSALGLEVPLVATPTPRYLHVMAAWVRVCSVVDCPVGESREFVVGDRIVAIFHTEDQFFALDGVCPHQGGPLGKGKLQGSTVTCPWHGWQFNVATGQHLTNASVCHPRFELRVVDDEVLICVSDAGATS